MLHLSLPTDTPIIFDKKEEDPANILKNKTLKRQDAIELNQHEEFPLI